MIRKLEIAYRIAEFFANKFGITIFSLHIVMAVGLFCIEPFLRLQFSNRLKILVCFVKMF